MSDKTMDILELQHIATKRALLNVLKSKFDYDEKILVGDAVHRMEDVRIDRAISDEARAELARLRAIEAALIVLLKSRNCYHDGQVEIPEEISAQFDIGLDDARQIAAALEAK